MSGSIEEFDDDTDFALPSAPNAVVPTNAGGGGGGGDGAGGMSMDGLQQMMAQMQAGGGGPSGMPPGMPPGMMGPSGPPPDPQLSAEEKRWVTLYPIYFDAKRRFEKGCRRVAYNDACLWPKSDEIERAAARLTLMHAHEARKSHPRDWQNPGRVKIQLFNEVGKPLSQTVPTKKALLRAVAKIIQPTCGGSPPPLPAHPKEQPVSAAREKKKDEQTPIASKKTAKGAAATATTSTTQNNKNSAAKQSKPRHRLPIRIDAHDRVKAARASSAPKARLPVHSPGREAGMLNADFGGMLGGMQGMGPLGAMMGQMGMGGDDDDDEEAAAAEEKAAEEKKAKDPMQNLSRRQKKRVIRVGR